MQCWTARPILADARNGLPLRRLTFDMRGAKKAQPFGHPLDGRVRARRGMQLLASNGDGLGPHRVVLEVAFQVRPASKNAPDFAPAAALCWIVRFAASLSEPRVLKPFTRDARS